MSQSVLEQVNEQIDETTRKASRAASAVADAFEDGLGTARRVVKQGGRVATEFYDDTRRRVQRHPAETVAATFLVGIAAGAAIGWMIGRRQS
jgi:hypothetical protein